MTLDKLTDYYCNTGLLDEIRALLAPSYAVLGSFIMRGLTEPIPGMEAQLLLLRDEAGQLAAFCKFSYLRYLARRHFPLLRRLRPPGRLARAVRAYFHQLPTTVWLLGGGRSRAGAGVLLMQAR